MTDNWGEPEGF
jgi:3-oxoacyl-[acyl-carrier protein] reductase